MELGSDRGGHLAGQQEDLPLRPTGAVVGRACPVGSAVLSRNAREAVSTGAGHPRGGRMDNHLMTYDRASGISKHLLKLQRTVI